METDAAPVSSKATVIGWIFTVLSGLVLLASSAFKSIAPVGTEENIRMLGLRMDQLTWLAPLEAAVAIVYLIPRTAVLGAVLIAGYMGGSDPHPSESG